MEGRKEYNAGGKRGIVKYDEVVIVNRETFAGIHKTTLRDAESFLLSMVQ